MIHSPDSVRPELRPGHDSLDIALSTFEQTRPRLLHIACRVLGDAAEAEDIVQEAWLRWHRCDREAVRNPTAFLVATTTRLAINATQSARARRESSVGRWVREPADTCAGPTTEVERNEALELGIAVLLERLSPSERAAYLLRHAFDYSYAQIAARLELTEVNARQLVSRAGRRVAVAHRHQAVDVADRDHLVRTFMAAARRGDLAPLEHLLATAAASTAEHGGCRTPRRAGRPGHRPRHGQTRGAVSPPATSVTCHTGSPHPVSATRSS